MTPAIHPAHRDSQPHVTPPHDRPVRASAYERIYFVTAWALLLVAGATAVLAVRSFWVSDWATIIHRQAPGRLVHASVATLNGVYGVSFGSPNGSDHGDPRDTLVQYNRQRVGGGMVYPFAAPGPRRFGFGLLRLSGEGFYQLTAPGWFVPSIPAAAGLLALRRARRLRRQRRLGMCPSCGYDLRATPNGQRCPECGAIE